MGASAPYPLRTPSAPLRCHSFAHPPPATTSERPPGPPARRLTEAPQRPHRGPTEAPQRPHGTRITHELATCIYLFRYVYTKKCLKIWLVRQKCLTLSPNPDEEARGLSFNQPKLTTMSTKHTESVRWHILKDRDGRVHMTSDRGVMLICDNPKETRAKLALLVQHTMDALTAVLEQDSATIKFYLEF